MAPVRQADPTLPPPWQALLDPPTGLRYYWNPDTNVTTYDRPAPVSVPGHAPVNGRSHDYDQGRYNGSGQSGAINSYGGNVPTSGGAQVAGELSVAEYRAKNDLTIMGEGAPDPFQTFEAVGFPHDIMDEIRRAGFSAPTPIQAQSWAVAMQGRDVVAIAKTGSGKTCGYLLPGLLHINATRKDPRAGPTILVLAPTRELAVQIKDEADKFGRSSGIRNTCVYGGAPKGPQLRDINNGVQIVIATPGRLNDFLESGQIRLHQVSYLVLDEADRMLDMGFEPQIQKIVRTIPRHRQTLFYSATWPKEVKNIASQFVVNQTVHIFIGGVDDRLVANKAITQHVEIVNSMDKVNRVIQILRTQPPGSKVIIFCSTKRMCDQLCGRLREYGAAAIHGDKSQSERDWVLRNFRDGRSPIMVATDVAARGLDIPNVAGVINFDFPNGVEDYIHRIGRTGRAGNTGTAWTFLGPQDGKYAKELMRVLREAEQYVPPEVEALSMRSAPAGSGRWKRGGGGGGGGYGGGGGGGGYGGFPPANNYGPPPSYGGSGSGGYGMPAAAPAAYAQPAAAYPMPADPYGSRGGRDDRGRDRYKGRSRSRSRSRSRDRHRSRSSRRSRSRSPDYSRFSPRR
mmetsp:Transcript_29864/g.84173  ORF Transcript_29864/g.84173 Transcript_29864/m.84173 type:complete len:625 (+) Transcript_29864:371-2245(+)